MEASLYILLPEGDAVLDIPQTKEAWNSLFAPLLHVKEYARIHGISLRVFFDMANISRFMEDAGDIVEDGSYLEKPSLVLKRFIGSNSSDVQKLRLLDTDCSYIRWDTITCTTDPNTPLVVKNAYESPQKSCVISLLCGIPTDYYQVSIIKDRAYGDGLPILKNIPIFFKAEECIEWLSSLQDGHFSLIGNPSFIRTSYHWNNQCIFRKADDNTYWYFDYYHRENKIHYEVFNLEGDHVGEASETGVLMDRTADPEKSIKNILHGKKR